MYKAIITLFIILLAYCSLYSQDTILYINEILSSNENINKDRFNEYDDWIELYNPNDFPVNYNGLHISNDKNNLTKYKFETKNYGLTTINPKSYKLIWFDNSPNQGPNHTNFKLSSNNEELYLISRDGKTIIDRVEYKNQRIDISYGRYPDGSNEFYYFTKPSPEKSNNLEKSFIGISENPVLNLYGGFYNNKIEIVVNTPKNAKIYYTINGGIPDEKNGILYKNPIEINNTSVLRLKIFEENKIPSLLFSQTYFINENFTLPVISLTTNNIEQFTSTDPKINVYKENPINIEYYENNNQIFNTLAGFRMVGKAIRNYPQKSLSVRFRNSYGISNINHKLFKEKSKSKYYALLLRNSGNDCSETLFKDALIHNLVVNSTNVDCQGYQPVIVYLNGNYWGIHNLREKINKYYIASNHKNIDYENIDMIEWGSKPIQGDNHHYSNLIKFINNNDLTLKSNYDSVCKMIDIDNFIDYQITEIFIANIDWPMANMKYWRPRTKDGKWRWILFDTDLSFTKTKSRCPGHHNTLDYALGINNCHLPHLSKALVESTVLLQKLIKNEEFKKKFIVRFYDLLNTSFSSENILSKIDEMKKELEPEIPKHIERWKNQNGISSLETWNYHINQMIDFAKERADTMRFFLNNKFNIQDTANLSITSQSNNKIKVNSLLIDGNNNNLIYFKNAEINLEAIDNKNSKFIKWSDGNNNASRTIILKENTSLEAIFSN